MLDRAVEESAPIEPDSRANAMMSACHCGAAMKRMAAARCGVPEESKSRGYWKDPEAGSD